MTDPKRLQEIKEPPTIEYIKGRLAVGYYDAHCVPVITKLIAALEEAEKDSKRLDKVLLAIQLAGGRLVVKSGTILDRAAIDETMEGQ